MDEDQKQKLPSEDRPAARPQAASRAPVMSDDDSRKVYGQPGNQPSRWLGTPLRQGYDDFKKHQAQKDVGDQDRAQGLRNYWKEAGGEDEGPPGFGWAQRKASKRLARGIWKRRRLLGLTIAGSVVAVFFAFAGFLSTFKMDHIMSNIDTQAFARMQGSLDVRNTDYIRTYMELRLADICPESGSCAKLNVDKDNLFFRSDTVRRSKNPVFNWYRTMRSSSFEKDVFEKNGIILTGGVYRDKDGVLKPRTIKFTVKGDNIQLPSTISDAFKNGDWGKVTELLQNGSLDDFFDTQVFTANSARRAAIKDVVKSHTQWYNVFKRRQLRKDLFDKTGSGSWRFFDDTRTKIDAKKIQMRNKIIDAITPNNTRTGAFINCLFGINDCKFTADPGNPADNARASGRVNTPDELNADSSDLCRTDPTKCIPTTEDFSTLAEAITKSAAVGAKVFNAAGWASLLNNLAKVDKNLTSGVIGAQVAVARSVQAMALYQTFETIRDQMQTGQLTSEEVNQFMQAIAQFSASEAWIKVVEGKGDPTKLALASGSAAAVKYCSANYQAGQNEFAYLCNNTVIGGASNAKKMSQLYTDSAFGKILHPILKTYDNVFGWFGDAFNSIFNRIFGPAFQLAFDAIGQIPGVKHAMDDGLSWATGQLSNFLGAGPMYGSTKSSAGVDTPLVPAGQLANGVIQGAAASAETAGRENGAAVTTADSQNLATQHVIAYQGDQSNGQPLFSRYLSPNNPRSLTATSLFAISQLRFNSVSSFFDGIGSMFSTLASAVHSPFTHTALAASSNFGYAAAQIAQIQTYDFPKACFGTNPLQLLKANSDGTAANLAAITNLTKIFPSAQTNDLTIAKLMNSDQWYTYLYQQEGADQIINRATQETKAAQVYNCALLDNSVMGDLGYTSGYTSDNGYPQ